MFVGQAWEIRLRIALLRPSNGSLNDLYAEHEQLLGALNWREADAALRGAGPINSVMLRGIS